MTLPQIAQELGWALRKTHRHFAEHITGKQGKFLYVDDEIARKLIGLIKPRLKKTGDKHVNSY